MFIEDELKRNPVIKYLAARLYAQDLTQDSELSKLYFEEFTSFQCPSHILKKYTEMAKESLEILDKLIGED